MNDRVFTTLELNKVLARLGAYAAFSASESLVAALTPSTDSDVVNYRQQETAEACTLLNHKPDVSVGGARDVREAALNAQRHSVLAPETLLDIKGTLWAGINLRRAILKETELDLPALQGQAERISENRTLISAIGNTLSDYGEVLDSASDKLAGIRSSLRQAHDRLQTKLQTIIQNKNNQTYLQETIVTLRGGRYVIPIKAEHKGRIKGVVHDQSSSGATLFIEPLATVEINNEIRQLELAEEEEVLRILADLSAQVGEHAPEIVETVDAIAALDVAFAKARYAFELDATRPEMVDFPPTRKPEHPGSVIKLYTARHPLLDPAEVVPVTIDLDDETYALVITGPNTGGKTVSLKTVGLLALMAQCGLHIPAADGSALSVFGSIYADIGDEQSIEQSLSTFSGHMRNIIPILDQASDGSLVILDELGAGTDPAEGAALARAIMRDLLSRGATTFIATHYPELKVFAHSTPGVRNASMEFDLTNLSPTYRLIVGLPGSSNALAIATRLGLPARVVTAARGMVGESDLQIEDMLHEIDHSRSQIGATQERLEKAYAEIRESRDDLRDELVALEDERREILNSARLQARAELDAIRAEVAALRSQLQTEDDVTLEELDEFDELAETLEDSAELEPEPPAKVRPVRAMPAMPDPHEGHAVQTGDRVLIRSLGAEGEVLSIKGQQAELQLGQMRFRAGLSDLIWRASPDDQSRGGSVAIKASQPASPGLELHLRGQIVEDALLNLDRYLDNAYMAGLPWVRIVHGKGSGKLRTMVREMLANHPLVERYEQAKGNEGGAGVTIATLVSRG